MTVRSVCSVTSVLLAVCVPVFATIIGAVFFYLAVFSGRNVNLPGDGLQDLVVTAFGAVVIACPVANLLGLSLAIVAIVRGEPRRLTAGAGFVLNGILLLAEGSIGVLSVLGASA